MSGPRTNAAFYAAPVADFLTASEEEVYAPLASHAAPIFPILCATEARDDLDRARRTDPKARIGTSRSAVRRGPNATRRGTRRSTRG